MKEEKTARLAELIFYNKQNFYSIAVFETDSEQFYAVGYLPSPRPGREYSLTGEWKTHPKYGEQFSFTACEEKEPGTAEGILAFLSSGAIKGIGSVTAKLIVKQFGENTLKIMGECPERLTEISGIGKIKAAKIAEGYKAHREYADTVMELSAFDIPSNLCLKLYAQYGRQAADITKENPYRLSTDIEGFGFKKADGIAKKLGFDPESPFRIKSALHYVLEEMASEGNTYLPISYLVETTAGFIEVQREIVSDVLSDMFMDGKVYADKISGTDCAMLYRYYRAEKKVAASLYRLCSTELDVIAADYDKLIYAVEKEKHIELSPQQRAAVTGSLKNGVSIITGGPGTGKTTIIKAITAILDAAGVSMALAAPTGRAAKRMEEATGEAAFTVHRLLEYSFEESTGEMHFGKNEGEPLSAQCIIVDEMSMTDILLMEALVSAVKTGSRLILVGDADQLPPVGAGSVLKDMIASELIYTVCLTDIFRQAGESLIVVNAHLINRGEYPSFNEKGKDFFMLRRTGEREIADTIVDLCTRRLPKFIGGDNPQSKIQVLTPTRKGNLGSAELNRLLQQALNPPENNKAEKCFGERIFRVGDRVMQNKNNYQLEWTDMNSFEKGLGVFNGDLGIIRDIDNDRGIVSVLFDGERLASYDYKIIDELEAAFAMTVHKSQGSEFPVLVMPVWYFPPMLATRNLLYTAVTRAKQTAVLVGNPEIVNAMVDNKSAQIRYSGLEYRLEKLWELEEF